MTEKSSGPTNWADLFLAAGGFGGVGLLASAVMNSDRFKPVTRERLLALFDEHAYFEEKAFRLDREALDLYALQLEHLSRGESVPAELDLQALEIYRASQDAKADAARKRDELERGKALLLAQLLDERRRGRAMASALRMLSASLWKCGEVRDGPSPSSQVLEKDEVLAALAARRGVDRAKAEEMLDAVGAAVETVMRSGAIPSDEWSLFEEALPTIDGGCSGTWKYEKSIDRLDETLVRVVQPPWRERQHPEKSDTSAT